MSVYEGDEWEVFVKSLAEASDSEKLSTLAHELKRHFPIIKSYADISKHKLMYGTATSEEIIGYLERIAEAAADAEKITDAIAAARQK